MATSRSARRSRRKLSQTPAAVAKRQKRAELRAAKDARSASEAVGSDPTLGDIQQRQLDQLERVADKLGALATIAEKGRLRPEPTSVAGSADGPAITARKVGIIEEATSRVDHAVQRIQGARNIVRSRVEKLCGPIPEAAGSKGTDTSIPTGDVHGLHFALCQLDNEIASLFDHVDRLAGL